MTKFDINGKQDMADLLGSLDGVNASSVALPMPSKRINSNGDNGRYADTWWDELIAWGEAHEDKWIGAHRGDSPNGSELIGYHAVIDGACVTLIVLSYNNDGFDGVCLVDGHLPTLEDIVYKWMGDTNIEDYRESWVGGNPHAILQYIDIPLDWEVVDA